MSPHEGGDPIPLLRPQLTIGRRPDSDIVLPFPNVSARHSELKRIDGFWQLIDLNSRNGTTVNGIRVRKKWIFPDDEIGFAKHFYRISYQQPQGVSPPEDEEEDPFSMSLLEKLGLERPAPRRPQRPLTMPGAARKTDPKRPAQPERKFSDEENAAVDWLDDESRRPEP